MATDLLRVAQCASHKSMKVLQVYNYNIEMEGNLLGIMKLLEG